MAVLVQRRFFYNCPFCFAIYIYAYSRTIFSYMNYHLSLNKIVGLPVKLKVIINQNVNKIISYDKRAANFPLPYILLCKE